MTRLQTFVPFLFAAAVALGAVLALAGCGGGDDEADESRSSPVVTAAHEPAESAARSAIRRVERQCEGGTQEQRWTHYRLYDDRTRIRIAYMGSDVARCEAAFGSNDKVFVLVLRVGKPSGLSHDVRSVRCVDVLLPRPVPPGREVSGLRAAPRSPAVKAGTAPERNCPEIKGEHQISF